MFLAADVVAFDTGFGVGGKAKFDLSGLEDKAVWAEALPDGKLLVSGTTTRTIFVGDMGGGLTPESGPERFLCRLMPDGSIDDTFGDDGVVRFDMFGSPDDVLALQPDGKILVGNKSVTTDPTADSTFAVVRFNPDGTLDKGFGGGGVAVANLYPTPLSLLDERVTSLAVQPDGKVIAAGLVNIPGGEHVPPGKTVAGLVRFNPDGAVDESFGRHVGDVNLRPWQIVVAPDGRIVLGGDSGGHLEADNPAGGFRFARFNGDGTLDASFGQGGTASADMPAASDSVLFAHMTDLLLQPDGKLAAAGNIGPNSFGVVRLNGDGSRDGAFGANGVVVGKGVQVLFDGQPAGQYRLRYDTASATLQVAAAGCGIERVPFTDPTKPIVRRATGLQVFDARLDSHGSVISAGRVQNLPMTGAESIAAAVIQDDGKIVGVGRAFPTQDAGEGPAYDQTADVLVVRFDPETLPAITDALTFVAAPVPSAPLQYIDYTSGDHPIFNGTGNGSGGSTLSFRQELNPAVPVVAATFSGRTDVHGGRVYAFRITFPSQAVARQTRVSVTGPGGFTTAAQTLRVKETRPAPGAGAGASSTTRPAVVSYRAPAPGGKFDAADAGTYVVWLNYTAGQTTASGQPVGMFTVAPRRGAQPPATPDGVVTTMSGLLRGTASVPGSATGWILYRTDPGATAEVVELDLGQFPGEAAALANRRVTVTGSFHTQTRPGRGTVVVFVVSSIARAT